MDFARGNFIDNQWIKPEGGSVIRSYNPARPNEVVLEAPTDPSHAALAVTAAAKAWPAWAALSPDERIAALRRFARELTSRTEALARAITMEMGKTIREARLEAQSLLQRIDLVAEQQLPNVKSWTAPGIAGECRYHPLGVIAVLGPFNFPLHLCHAHIIPALATGNTVVVKPSDRTPLSFQRYMEAWAAAGLPPVLQMVQGGADVGRALLDTPELRGVAFTGSWRTGHAIQQQMLARPEVLVALEMGGQNMSIVLEDADLDQALEGVLLGGFLTTGQRCTCTSRVLIQRSIADAFIKRLIQATRRLTFGDPMGDVFMGPMASVRDRDYVEALCQAGRDAGAEVLLAAELRDGGAWRGPSIHLISKDHDSDYTREEVFGPDIAITIVDDLDDAISVVKSSPYGLSVALFSSRRAAFEAVYLHTNVGCVNWNRSTNRAVGAFPFGGVGRSGNFRPAGADAVRYTTYPVQVQWNEPGVLENDPFVRQAIASADPILALELRHRIEEALEPYGIYPDFDGGASDGVVRIPQAQLDLGVDLARPLQQELKARQVSAELSEAGLKFPLPSSDKQAQRIAKALSDSLYAIRSLHPQRFLGRRPAGSAVPNGDKLSLPRSESFMKRLVGDDFIPDDKKPPVVDLFRSAGPYIASVDDEALVFFDAASQIATHAAGLNPPSILEAVVQGRFGATPIDGLSEHPEIAKVAARLREEAGDHPYVQFSNSGAEANEIALATAATRRPGRRAVVSFSGAFHGRTMLALHSTWNPSKRLRFELKGYEARWLELPVDDQPALAKAEPEHWLESWQAGATRPEPTHEDALLNTEIEALLALEAALADDQVVAVLTEPMQAEGGERYASNRFFRAVRVLTEAYKVPLIMDEVQCGYHLGGPFFWHKLFELPSPPDLITCAKKAQVGVTLSRFPIPVKAETQPASVIRGALYAELLGDSEQAAGRPHAFGARTDLMAFTQTQLDALAAAFPDAILNPRLQGWSFGFDLPTVEKLNHLVNQRLWRGYMIYGAGDRGLRFRFHPEITPTHIEALFERLHASVQAMEAGEPTTWREGGLEGLSDKAAKWPATPTKLGPTYKLTRVSSADWPLLRPHYEALQALVYEEARLDDFEHLSALMQSPNAVCFIITHGAPKTPAKTLTPPNPSQRQSPVQGTLVGACLAFPLEHFADLDGPRQDPSLGRDEALYSADLTVHPEHRGRGLGRALKEAQVSAAMGMRQLDGSPRFAFLTGRNKVGATDAMAALNTEFGAWRVARYHGQYGEPDAASDYYRIPLTWPRLPAFAHVQVQHAKHLDLDQGFERRLGDVRTLRPGTEELREAYAEGRLNGALVNKLSLCNFVTPGVVRAHEWLRLQAPKGLAHLVLSSGRGEGIDKTLRALKYHRGQAKTVISVGPVFAGLSTAASRAISLPEDDERNWFGWPTVADPTVDMERSLLELRKRLERNPEDVLAIIIEPVWYTTGRAVPEAFWAPLRALCDQFNVPLVTLENTTGGYRSGRGLWRTDTLPITVDAVICFPGGQLGLGFVSDRYYVAEKLTLISTWDGDELALARLILELRVARGLPVAQRAGDLHKALAAFGEVSGEGLFVRLQLPQAEVVQRRLLERGIRVGLTEDKALRFVPALNLSTEDIQRLVTALREVSA